MPSDFAMDTTGDWIFSGRRDLMLIRGDDVIRQRVMNRLRLKKGWLWDPTGGLLGSRIHDGLHMPRERILNELPLYVQEALEPMEDISVVEVTVEEDTEDLGAVWVHVTYVVLGGTIRELPARSLSLQVRI